MNDITAIGFFLACILATLGLLRVIEWLRPREQALGDSGARTLKQEARQ